MNAQPPNVQRFEAIEADQTASGGWMPICLDACMSTPAQSLHSCEFSYWEPVAYDALALAALVEHCDRSVHRPAMTWGRQFSLRMSVHDPERWNKGSVISALEEALAILTSDQWSIDFRPRKSPVPKPPQYALPIGVRRRRAVMPFSDGLDSRAAAFLAEHDPKKLGLTADTELLRLRVGKATKAAKEHMQQDEAFWDLPFPAITPPRSRRDSSGQARGFKFAVVTAMAAYLADAECVIVPESGQGALGPAMAPLGQIGRDYRSHPRFTKAMSQFLKALLGRDIRFSHPFLWQTKGQTVADYIACGGNHSWQKTRSCWRRGNWVSVEGSQRQCGICAACMLRRMSVHAAGLEESRDTYAWPHLDATCWTQAAASGLPAAKVNKAAMEYAVAGTQHLDQLAQLAEDPDNAPDVRQAAFELSRALGRPEAECQSRLAILLEQHKQEYEAFMASLSPRSFLKNWVCRRR